LSCPFPLRKKPKAKNGSGKNRNRFHLTNFGKNITKLLLETREGARKNKGTTEKA
jgi:hypothetical protein